MTDEQINIAIAESLGWINIYLGGLFRKTLIGCEPNSGRVSIMPDYTADLNACHEFEKTLTDAAYTYRFGVSDYTSSQTSDYFQLLMHGNQPAFLSNNCGKQDMQREPKKILHLAGGIRATARQRCEAYLRTIGKWKEDA